MNGDISEESDGDYNSKYISADETSAKSVTDKTNDDKSGLWKIIGYQKEVVVIMSIGVILILYWILMISP